MGTLFIFSCPHCGYEAEVSATEDRGFSAVFKPSVCTDCNELQNAFVGHYKFEGVPTYDDNEEFIPNKVIECICCKSLNLKDWNFRVCPKCNKQMNEGVDNTYWD